jgi:hypothetical protein
MNQILVNVNLLFVFVTLFIIIYRQMLPKEEKIGSNKLINRLIKQNRGRTLSKPAVADHN